MRKRAEKLHDPETGGAPYYAQQYRGIARDRFVRASLGAPSFARQNLIHICQELGCSE